MKTGIVRRIDDLGRVVIPKEVRRTLDIQEGDPLELSVDGNKIVYELYLPTCNYEEKVKRLIETLKQDDLLIEKSEYREARQKAIWALDIAYNALRQTDKGGKENE